MSAWRFPLARAVWFWLTALTWWVATEHGRTDDVLWAGVVLAEGRGPAEVLPREMQEWKIALRDVLSTTALRAEWKKSRLQLGVERHFAWSEPWRFGWEIAPETREEAAYVVRARLLVGEDVRWEARCRLARTQPIFFVSDEAVYFLVVR